MATNLTIRRILHPILALIALLAIAITTANLAFIPEWDTFQASLTYLSLAGVGVASVLLVKGTKSQTLSWTRKGPRLLFLIGTTAMISSIFLVSVWFCLLGLYGFLFPPTYHHRVDFPGYETTIYFYDASFIDSETLFMCRKGCLPFMYEIGNFGEVDAKQVTFRREGDWARCEVFNLHLPTGELEMTDIGRPR